MILSLSKKKIFDQAGRRGYAALHNNEYTIEGVENKHFKNLFFKSLDLIFRA